MELERELVEVEADPHRILSHSRDPVHLGPIPVDLFSYFAIGTAF
jgi:hypothetical protein